MRVLSPNFPSLLGLGLVSLLSWTSAQAGEIKNLQLSQGATGTRAEIVLGAEVPYRVIRLSAPDRLVVDLPEASWPSTLRAPSPAGVVKAVRTGAPSPGTTRIVFDLVQPVAELKPRIEQGSQGAALVIEWPGDGDGNAVPAADVAAAVTRSAADPVASSEATSRLISEILARNGASTEVPTASPSSAAKSEGGVPATTPAVAAAPPAQLPAGVRIATGVSTQVATGQPAPVDGATTATVEPSVMPAAPVKTVKEVMRNRDMRPLVIAIDAGHGGQDPGALGQGGKREKDITLSIARELARQINATPGLKAYLTRDKDVFIPLTERARLARQAKADMFVSIHADAAENRKAQGSSVYVLSLKGASSQRARWLADKENASDLIGGVRMQNNNTLASVLLDLTQSGQLRASEEAASHVLSGLGRIGRNHKAQVERANFAVLRTSDMPAMLVETAFISNPEEERRLADPAHQRAIARAVLDGVNAYFVRQPPPGTQYAARAERASAGGAAGGSP